MLHRFDGFSVFVYVFVCDTMLNNLLGGIRVTAVGEGTALLTSQLPAIAGASSASAESPALRAAHKPTRASSKTPAPGSALRSASFSTGETTGHSPWGVRMVIMGTLYVIVGATRRPKQRYPRGPR